MEISLKWIKKYVDIDLSTDELVHKLTMAGLEVEKIEHINKDTVLEMEITPNRPDCLSMLGIAREISAILNTNLKYPKTKQINFPKKKCDISIEDESGCSRYIGTVIENVQIKKADDELIESLTSLGNKPINNIVDITNFSLMENGQPLHAFDYDKLIGGKIIVRRAKKGESIVTLDGEERKLDPSILVIADEKRPVAIAGVMGGKETEVSASTKNILLESAYFDPILIRRTSRKLALSSDSSYRFERGVDFENVLNGANRAIQLILKSAGGEITCRNDLNLIKKSKIRPKVSIAVSDINSYLGADLKVTQCKSILKKLEFETDTTKDKWKVTPPSFRNDINQPVDVIEEVARVVGYDNLPLSLPKINAVNIAHNPTRKIRQGITNAAISQGFDEIITYTMINQKALDKSGQSDLKGLKIMNPLTKDQEIMRPSLLPSFLQVVMSNVNKGEKDLRLFEMGKVYTSKGERETLGMIVTGSRTEDWRHSKKEEIDFYDLKGAVVNVIQHIKQIDITFESEALSFFENGQSAIIRYNNSQIGMMGKINNKVLADWDIKQKNVFFAQVDLQKLYQLKSEVRRFEAINEYPSITRDVSLAVKKEISYQKIKNIVLKLGTDILKEIRFCEEYLGDKVSKEERGIIFSIKYQASDRTLREEEVTAIHDNIIHALTHDLGVLQR